jgi:hypothetical protein
MLKTVCLFCFVYASLFAETKVIPAAPFSKISAQSNLMIWIEQSATESVKLEGSAQGLQKIEAVIEDDILKIRPKNIHDQPLEKITVYANVKNLTSLNLSGSVNVTGHNTLKSKQLNLHITGTTILNLDLKTDTLEAYIEGNSKLKLTGDAKNQIISIMGNSHIDAKNFKTQTTKLNCSGFAQVTVNASSLLNVTSSGNSKIFYVGAPKIKKHLSGHSSLEALKESK